VAKQFGIPLAEAERQMQTLILLSGKEQLSEKYLGISSKKGDLAKVLKETADFLVEQKTIKSAPELATFADGINPSYLEKALQ
jgi:taurine transport system substrate-binding protein